jgi:hypothetical protein
LRRAPFTPLWIAIAPLAAGCSGVLGLDAPNLDPCISSSCLDAVAPLIDATAPGAGGDADTQDARGDAAINGVRCGGGTYAVTGCTGSTPLCCQTTDDAGVPTYACTTTAGACDGYPIACASNADCSGNNVCCHYSTGTKCEPSCTSDTALVCDPDGPADQCPSGWKCDGPVTDDGVDAPYFVCSKN